MKNFCLIPQYNDTPETWDRFIRKASKGSIRATDILIEAEFQYMIDLTNNPNAPDELNEYMHILKNYFPDKPPLSKGELIKNLIEQNLLRNINNCYNSPFHNSYFYNNLWNSQRIVCSNELMFDSIYYCYENWTYNNFLKYEYDFKLEFNSQFVASRMIYLLLTWNA